MIILNHLSTFSSIENNKQEQRAPAVA